jgi:hypothetical protein
MEPSMLAIHFVSLLGLFALGLKRYLIALPFLVILMLSTSSTAYFGGAILYLLWVIINIKRQPKAILVVTILIFSSIALGVVLDNEITDGRILRAMVFEKGDSQSAQVRMNADKLALEAFVDTWGFGTGIGSTRSSSFFTTALATFGAPGSALLLIFWVLVLASCIRAKTDLDRAIFFGILGFIVCWLISIPDMHFPLVWLLAAIAPSWAKSKFPGDMNATNL